MKRDRFAVGLTTKDGRGEGPEEAQEVVEAEVVNIKFLKLTYLKPD